MFAYIVRRLLLIIPTLLGIMTINFLIVQAAPGGPVEQALAKLKGDDVSAMSRFSQSEGAEGGGAQSPGSLDAGGGSSKYRGSRGIEPELIADIEKQYGFDKPAPERFVKMLRDYARFDFGTSFYRDTSVVELVKEKMPVSISLGLWTTLLVYLVSIPLGIKKATRDGTAFDVWTSSLVLSLIHI